MCVTRNSIYIATSEDSLAIHQFSTNGIPIAAFGHRLNTGKIEAPSESLAETARSMLNRVRIYCSESQSAIILVNRELPVIRAYTLDGRLIWQKEVEGLRQFRYMTGPSGRGMQVARDAETGTAHTVEAVSGLTDQLFAVTYGESSNHRRSDSYHIRIFEISTGMEVGKFDSPDILAAADRHRIYRLAKEPYPTISVTGW